jgi:hypothetical protein
VLYVQASSQSTGGDLRLVLIDPTGAASSSNVLDQGYEDVSDLRLGWSGKMHLSVALLAGDILGTLLIRLAVASGQVFNQGLNYLSGADGIVSVSNVVFGGSQFAFAWVDEQDFGVHVAFVSEDGNSFTPEPGYVVSGSVPSVTSVSPVIGWTGQDYVVGWFAASGQAGQTRLVTVHVDTSGNPSGAPQTWGTLSSGLVGEGLTWGPGEIAAIVGSNQDDGSASGWEYSLARFSASGDAGSSLAVGETAPAYAPFAAWTGEDYALTWVDTVQGGPAHDRVAFARAGGCD